jgi:hypothetical protein
MDQIVDTSFTRQERDLAHWVAEQGVDSYKRALLVIREAHGKEPKAIRKVTQWRRERRSQMPKYQQTVLL